MGQMCSGGNKRDGSGWVLKHTATGASYYTQNGGGSKIFTFIIFIIIMFILTYSILVRHSNLNYSV